MEDKKVLFIVGSRSWNPEFIIEQKVISKETEARFYFASGRSMITEITFIDKKDIEKDQYKFFATFDSSKLNEYINILDARYNESIQKQISDLEKRMGKYHDSAEQLRKQLNEDGWKINE
jgi:hypothetical protein